MEYIEYVIWSATMTTRPVFGFVSRPQMSTAVQRRHLTSPFFSPSGWNMKENTADVPFQIKPKFLRLCGLWVYRILTSSLSHNGTRCLIVFFPPFLKHAHPLKFSPEVMKKQTITLLILNTVIDFTLYIYFFLSIIIIKSTLNSVFRWHGSEQSPQYVSR